MHQIEGKIVINIHSEIRGEGRVSVCSQRQVHASQVMVGKTVEQTLSLIPLMFNVCGIAQSRASLLAVQRAINISSDTHHEIARDMLVLVESAREHLYRILLDWPKLFGKSVNPKALPALGQLITDFKNALFESGDAFSLHSRLQFDAAQLRSLIDNLDDYLNQHIFQMETADWLKIRDIEGLNQWTNNNDGIAASSVHMICEDGWSSQGYSDSSALPPLSTRELIKRFESDQNRHFIEQPDWKGKVYETTSFIRQSHHPLIGLLKREFHNTLITRWVARLVELARIPQQLSVMRDQLIQSESSPLKPVDEQIGLAQVEAARGRLIHHLKISDNHISSYQILAPTEWNFHPQGLICKSLTNTSTRNPLKLDRLARLLINAIDPCVGYELRIL
jgi:hypothetical protein